MKIPVSMNDKISGFFFFGISFFLCSCAYSQAFKIDIQAITPLSVSGQNNRKVGYSLVDRETTGIRFAQELSNGLRRKNRVLLLGSGVGVFDFDGDGRNDILFLKAEGKNELYRNLGGFNFERILGAAGMALPHNYSTGVSIADVNNDGFKDVIISTIDEGPKLFICEGSGTYQQKSRPGFPKIGGAISGVFGDIDGDGDLDFYQAMFRENSIKDNRSLIGDLKVDQKGSWIVPQSLRHRLVSTRNLKGQPMLMEKGREDQLFINNGAGQFDKIEPKEYFHPILNRNDESPLDGWTLSACFHDFNRDGYLDMYSCSDFLSPDRFWVNNGKGGFSELSWPFIPKTSYSSMDVAWGDLNNDGLEDFFVVDMLARKREDRIRQTANMGPNVWMTWANGFNNQVMRNTLYRNRGDGSFSEIALKSNLAASDWSWTTRFEDVDLDGLLDIIVGNGTPHDVQNSDAIDLLYSNKTTQKFSFLPADLPPHNVPNVVWKNLGDFKFREFSDAWNFSSNSYSQSMAFGDLDGDGDNEVVINNFDGIPELYRCDTISPRIVVRIDTGSHPGLLDRLRLELKSGGKSQYRSVRTSQGYLSQSSTAIVFACHDQVSELYIYGPGDISPITTVSIERNSLAHIKVDPIDSRKPKRNDEVSLPGKEYEKLIVPGNSPKWTFSTAKKSNSQSPVFRHWDTATLQASNFGEAVKMHGSVGYIQPDNKNGFKLCHIDRDSEKNYLWNVTRLRLKSDWPSQPLGMKMASDNALNEGGCQTVVFGTSQTDAAKIKSWLMFVDTNMYPELQVSQSFDWIGQEVGKMTFSRDGNYLFIGAKMSQTSSRNQGGGVIFFKNHHNKWVYLRQATQLIPARFPIVGAEWVKIDESLNHLILTLHGGTIEILNVVSPGAGQLSTKGVSLGEKYSGLWMHSNLFGMGDKYYLLLGNIGQNFMYGNTGRLRWVLAQTDAGHLLSLPVEDNEGKQYLFSDRESLNSFFPQLSKIYPTRKSYALATLKDLESKIPTLRIYHNDPINTLEHKIFEIFRAGKRLEFKELDLGSIIQEAPLMTSAILQSQNAGKIRIVIGQNFSSLENDYEPIDSGGGGILEIDSGGRIKFDYLGQLGVRLFSDVKRIFPGRWIENVSSFNKDSFLVFRNNLSPALFIQE